MLQKSTVLSTENIVGNKPYDLHPWNLHLSECMKTN